MLFAVLIPLPVVIMTPFGRPVVPEVYIRLRTSVRLKSLVRDFGRGAVSLQSFDRDSSS